MTNLISAVAIAVVGIAAILTPPFLIWRHEQQRRRRRYIQLRPRVGLERKDSK